MAHCKQGLYGDYSTRNLSAYYRQKYFVPADNQLQANPRLKATVNFSRVNLLETPAWHL